MDYLGFAIRRFQSSKMFCRMFYQNGQPKKSELRIELPKHMVVIFTVTPVE